LKTIVLEAQQGDGLISSELQLLFWQNVKKQHQKRLEFSVSFHRVPS